MLMNGRWNSILSPGFLLSFLIFLALSSPNVNAQTYAISLKPGSMGLGFEGARSFGPYYNVRIGYTFLNYDHTLEGDDEYVMDAELRMSAVTAYFDWFPTGGMFHLSSGLIYNMNDVTALLVPSQSHDVGGRIYTPDMLGSLKADLDFNRISPYLGLGFGNAHGTLSGFTFDIGAMYHGAPDVSLSAQGLLEPSVEQAPVIENNIGWFNFYPVVSVGYTYKF